MKTIMLLIIYLLIQSISKAQMVDSVNMKCERVWNLGKITDTEGKHYVRYIIKLSLYNYSTKMKVFLSDDKWEGYIQSLDNIYIYSPIFSSKVNHILSKKAFDKYLILDLPIHNYTKEKIILPIAFFWITPNEFSDTKYDNQIEAEIRRINKNIPTVKFSKEQQHEKQRKLFNDYDINGSIRKRFIIQKKKSENKDVLHCELKL